MMALLLEEEIFLRLALLLNGVAPRAVRTYFDSIFPPTSLGSTLKTNKKTLESSRFLYKAQLDRLFPRYGVPVSTNFDITLMICLIRNLTSVTQPRCGFNTLPQPFELTPGPDLARIKWYRNMLAHSNSNEITTVEFNIAWNDISDAVIRLGGQQMKLKCQELRVKTLDHSNREIMLEIKQTQDQLKELRQTVDTEHTEVMENLRELQDSNSTKQTEYSEVTGNLKKLQDSHSTLQTEHTEVTGNLRTLQDSHSTLQTEHTEVTGNLRTLQDSHSTLQTEHTEVTGNLRTLQDSHSTLQTEHTEVTEHLRTLQDSHSTLQTEHTEVTEHLSKLQVSHSTLQTEHLEVKERLKDPIPWNIRGQIKEELETWTEDGKMFIETNGSKNVLKCIKENSCVVVTGSSGIGKSSLVRRVALRMQDEGFDILPVKNPEEIIRWYNPYNPSKKILFVVDDFCGTYTINPMKLDSWKNLMGKINTLVKKITVKLIMSCRLQVYKDEKMKSLSFYHSCECNLLSEDLRLSKTEKQSIAVLYLKTKASQIEEFYDTFACFPLLCKLYSKNTNLIMVDFFKNPYTVYKEEIDKLQTEGAHVKYCALALCVMFNNRIKEEWLTEDVDKNIKTIIKNTFEACKLVKGTSRLVLRDELDILTKTFIKKDGAVYRTIHDKLFDFLAFYFGSDMIYCVINNASSQFIRERFVFEKNSKSDAFLIDVSDIYQQMYIQRVVDDWLKKKVVDVFCNINMDDLLFRQRILALLHSLEISQQKELASIYDTKYNSTALIHCCYKGDIDFVEWCLKHCTSNVNQCRHDGVSPLFFACQNGHTEVVQMLINNKADINKCKYTRSSPLYIACQEGHTEVVQILINNKDNYNNSRDNEASTSFIASENGYIEVVQTQNNNKVDINKHVNELVLPLFIACQKGHIKIIQMLINNNADIDKCIDNGASPLCISCEMGHIEVVQMLIKYKADINKCTDIGESPLCFACQEGHTEVAHMLINHTADINKCKRTGESPLFGACYRGHSEVVRMLINYKADINKCDENKVSPLYIACQEGHTEIAQVLINNKAAINMSRDNGASPLFFACQERNIEVVHMLINNEADINKCRDNGATPLSISCQKGHIKVVQMLINNKADINMCNNIGESPLFFACQEGHTEVVKILINNKADINKSTKTGESPIFGACYKGHIGVVQILINHKADINKCNDNGEVPLLFACQEGHTKVVQMLIDNKADINKCSRMGESPVVIGCYYGYIEIVELLLKHEADVNLKWEGLTPLDIARRQNHTNIVHLLQKHK